MLSRRFRVLTLALAPLAVALAVGNHGQVLASSVQATSHAIPGIGEPPASSRAGTRLQSPRQRGVDITSGSDAAGQAAAGAPLLTCDRGRLRRTPSFAAECTKWRTSGPVNVVIVSRAGDPAGVVSKVWRPARGFWLVAAADLSGVHGCNRWSPSGSQFESHINAVTRYHIKLIAADCAFSGVHAYIGDAHTDRFDAHHCGDAMVDMNAARDALAHDLGRIPGAHVTYLQARRPGTYPGGCGGLARDDGRTAYISIP